MSNFLEQLVAERHELSGYFVRPNVRVDPRALRSLRIFRVSASHRFLPSGPMRHLTERHDGSQSPQPTNGPCLPTIQTAVSL
jgi:hypothetical protein